MKSLKKFLSIAGFMLGIGGFVYAADIAVQRYTVGPADTQVYLLDDDGDTTQTGSLSVGSKTVAQINAATPSAVGNILLCSDCTRSAVCVSSGTGRGAYVIIAATGTFVGGTFSGLSHCQ